MFSRVRYSRPAFRQLHVPMQTRLYHTLAGRGASGRLPLLPLGIVVAPEFVYRIEVNYLGWDAVHKSLAQDCPVWVSPEFTAFKVRLWIVNGPLNYTAVDAVRQPPVSVPFRISGNLQ